MGAVIVIVLGVILIMFFIAVFDLTVKECEGAEVKLWDKIIAILIFLLVSAIILGVIGYLFFVPA
jgi:hypothetical protein